MQVLKSKLLLQPHRQQRSVSLTPESMKCVIDLSVKEMWRRLTSCSRQIHPWTGRVKQTNNCVWPWITAWKWVPGWRFLPCTCLQVAFITWSTVQTKSLKAGYTAQRKCSRRVAGFCPQITIPVLCTNLSSGYSTWHFFLLFTQFHFVPRHLLYRVRIESSDRLRTVCHRIWDYWYFSVALM